MSKIHKDTKTCSTCGIKKPLPSFLIKTTSHIKSYGDICLDCRIKLGTNFATEEEEEGGSGGGKRGRLRIDYHAKLFALEKQKEKKELIALHKKEHLKKAEINKEKLIKEKVIEEKSKKSREAGKSNITKAVNFLSDVLSSERFLAREDVGQTRLDVITRKNFELLMGLTALGSVSTMSPQWGAFLSKWLVHTGSVASFNRAWLDKMYTGLAGKFTAQSKFLDLSGAELQNKLLEMTRKTFEPGKK